MRRTPATTSATSSNATKSGTKFDDLDGDGDRDPVSRAGGVEIHLFGTDGRGNAVHEHATTDANGDYTLLGHRPGSYKVCETVPTGYTQSYPTAGADQPDTMPGAPHAGLVTITLTSGRTTRATTSATS